MDLNSPNPTLPSLLKLSAIEGHDLTEAREDALHTLAVYRTFVLTLEINRIRRSRIGFAFWVAYWEFTFIPAVYRQCGNNVTLARLAIDTLFKDTAKRLYTLMEQTQTAVLAAQTKVEITMWIRHLEIIIALYTYQRKVYARVALQELRRCIWPDFDIHGNNSHHFDWLFNDFVWAVFALDENCDYHPGPGPTVDEPLWDDVAMLSEETISYNVHMDPQYWSRRYRQMRRSWNEELRSRHNRNTNSEQAESNHAPGGSQDLEYLPLCSIS